MFYIWCFFYLLIQTFHKFFTSVLTSRRTATTEILKGLDRHQKIRNGITKLHTHITYSIKSAFQQQLQTVTWASSFLCFLQTTGRMTSFTNHPTSNHGLIDNLPIRNLTTRYSILNEKWINDEEFEEIL